MENLHIHGFQKKTDILITDIRMPFMDGLNWPVGEGETS